MVREALVEHLARRDDVLTAVVAPAGYGKTTAAVRIAAEIGRPTAWLHLEPADDDPARFWTYLAASLAGAGLDDAERVYSVVAGGGDGVGDAAATLLEGVIEASESPVTVVLDDLHAVTAEAVLGPLDRWLRQPVAGLRLVITSRAALPLAVGRLRTDGRLGEARRADLALDRDQAAHLLEHGFGVEGLDAAQLDALMRRTEGWPVGVSLAGLALRDEIDLGPELARFTGDSRHLSEYLTAEVSDALDDDTRAFVLATSVVSVLDPDLCDTLSGHPGSLGRLRRLERDHVFTSLLDGTTSTFQYHPLFREHLRATLLEDHPEQARELHERAARWFEQRAEIDLAVRHHLDAGSVDAAQRLIARSWLLFSQTGHFGTLSAWIDLLGDRATERTDVCLMMAWACLNLGRFDAIDAWLEHAERAADGDIDESMLTIEGTSMRAMAARHLGDLEAYRRLATTVVVAWNDLRERRRQLTDVDDPPIEAITTDRIDAFGPLVHGVVGSAALWAGDHTEARDALMLALAEGRTSPEPSGVIEAYLHLAFLDAESGDPTAAEDHADQALASVTAENEMFVRPTLGHLARAIAARRTGRPAEATAALVEARRVVDGAHEVLHEFAIELEQARLHHLCGDPAAARDAVRAAETIVGADPHPALAERIRRTRNAIRFVARDAAELPVGARELTEREHAVLRLLPHGHSRRELAAQLYVSENTIKTHLSSIRHKLGLSGRASIVERARELGLLDA